MRTIAARVIGLALPFAILLPLSATGMLGCGSSPEPTLYALSTVPGRGAKSWPRVIEVRRPGLAGYLDRSDIVGRVAGYRLRTKSGERWGEPLGDMIGRVLAADLSLRLPGTTVFREEAALSSDADARVEVDVQRFEAGDDGEVVLLAQVAVGRERPSHVSATRSVTLHAHPDGNGTEALVAAMSKLLGELADQIAGMVHEGEGVAER